MEIHLETPIEFNSQHVMLKGIFHFQQIRQIHCTMVQVKKLGGIWKPSTSRETLLMEPVSKMVHTAFDGSVLTKLHYLVH